MSGQKKSIKKQHAGVRFWWIYNLGGFEYFQEMCAVSKQYDVMHALTHITNIASRDAVRIKLNETCSGAGKVLHKL